MYKVQLDYRYVTASRTHSNQNKKNISAFINAFIEHLSRIFAIIVSIIVYAEEELSNALIIVQHPQNNLVSKIFSENVTIGIDSVWYRDYVLYQTINTESGHIVISVGRCARISLTGSKDESTLSNSG